MRRLSGKMRLAIFISIVWLMIFIVRHYLLNHNPPLYLVGKPKIVNFEETLFFGAFPIFIFWGIWWVRQGFKSNKEEKNKS